MVESSQEALHFLDYWRVIRSRKEIIIAVFLLVVLTGIVVTYAMPRVFMASIVIAVREDTPAVEPFSTEVRRYDPLFLRTQFEIIQSRPVLEEVIQKLKLDEKLGNAYGYIDSPNRFETTYKILSRSMKVQQYRDTNLIEIQIYLSEPKETVQQVAAETANKVAIVFRDQRMQTNREEIERALKAIYESFIDQEKKVEEAENKVEEIRRKYKLDIGSSSVGTDTALGKKTMTQLESRMIDARIELSDKKQRYEKAKSLTSKDLRDAAPHFLFLKDSSLVLLVAEKRKAEVEKSEFSKQGYGPNHPDVMRVEAIIKEKDLQIEDAVNGLRNGVEADYTAAKATVDDLQSQLEVLKDRERSAEGSGYQEFDQAVGELEHAKAIRDKLEVGYLAEKIKMRIPRTMVELVAVARPPDKNDAVSPKIFLNIILSILVGLGSGVGLAYFIEYLDISVKTIEDIERFMGVPVLGVIPQKVGPLLLENEDAHAEAYRVLRTNIQFSKKLMGGKTFCFTSGSMGEGKSLTLFNLAYVCAQLGDKVLIVDSDMHRPRQHKILNVPNRVGLVNVLAGEADLEDMIVTTSVPNLDFLPGGKLSAGIHGLLNTRRMKELVGKLGEKYDQVFFDAPPIIGVSDASLLAREVDAVLLVIQHRKYPKTVASRARDMLQNVGANLIGVVLNNINISRDYSYYYYHYYSYYSRSSEKEKEEADRRA